MSLNHVTICPISWTSQVPEENKVLIYQLLSLRYFVIAMLIRIRQTLSSCASLYRPAFAFQFPATPQENEFLERRINYSWSPCFTRRAAWQRDSEKKMPEDAIGWGSYSLPELGPGFNRLVRLNRARFSQSWQVKHPLAMRTDLL